MLGLIDLVVGFGWLLVPNGFLLERHNEAASKLPADWLRPLAAESRIAFHAQDAWPMALYLPPSPVAGESVPPDPSDRVPDEPAHSGERSAGPATVSARPRVVLFAPYYLATDGLVPVSRMPVDVAEYYFHALLEARLDQARRSEASDLGVVMARRAEQSMADVPAPHRLTAYSEAAADYGAHLLSIANEISRLAERHAAKGSSLCHLIEHPASLFGLWRRSFASASYPGRYPRIDPDDPVARTWVASRSALTAEDKRFIAARILRSHWTGDPAQDFDWLCEPVSG